MKLIKSIYITNRLFFLLGINIAGFCFSFFIPFLFNIFIIVFLVIIGFLLIDFIWLFSMKLLIEAQRNCQSKFSLNDDNSVEIVLRNKQNRSFFVDIIDEIPFQFQIRNFKMSVFLKPLVTHQMQYQLQPKTRGEYEFGNINLLIMSELKLIKRKIIAQQAQCIKVYPSIIQMKNFELYTFSKIAKNNGIKKMRRYGLSYEFEQIKTYNRGDDVRHINWKASARNQTLMINQYEDEKSQSVYNIIDKSRTMLMNFNGLTLMDYAINSSLVLSNIALKKHDKIGLITFSDVLGNLIKADNQPKQLKEILETLYKQKERPLESNYELLFYITQKAIKTRSLVFFYTNFESLYALERALPILRKINKHHLLVLIFFENIENKD